VPHDDLVMPTGVYATEKAGELVADFNLVGSDVAENLSGSGKKVLIPMTPEMDGWLLRHVPDFRDRLHTLDLEDE